MFNTRRDFMLMSAAAGLAGAAWPALAAIDPKLRSVLDAIADDILAQSPESLTQLGLDTGKHAGARARLNDRSLASRNATASDIARYKAMLARVNRASLTGHDRTLYDAVAYSLANGQRGTQFAFGGIGALGGGNPYVVSQQDGAYQSIPEFLDSSHKIESASDAEAYLSRLAAFGTALDQETERVRRDAGMGVIAPDFVLDTTLKGLKGLRAVPAADARMVGSLARRTKEKGIGGDWAGRATKIVSGSVYPALDRQIAAITALRAKATHDGGAWKLPKGDAYYAFLLENATSTNLTPAEIHNMGLEQGAQLDAAMDAVFRKQGMTQGSVGDRLAALTRDPKQLFPNTDAGKMEAVAYVQAQMNKLRAIMPKLSKMNLKADVTVKRVPADIEAGAALGYMNPAALDGSRPAIYYINLSDSSNWPKYTIPSLSAHEGLPGHSWQFAYIAEHRDEVPTINSLLGNNAYTEGWALYSEQLVDELGFYDDDPFGQIGMYQALRFRATRLVTDTGLHHLKWSREKAVDYMRATTGRSVAAVTSEVDRYCASPGQACGYKVGHTEIVRLRDKAKAALGAKFDVRDFDDVVVQTGGVPLTVLATVVDEYIAKAKA